MGGKREDKDWKKGGRERGGRERGREREVYQNGQVVPNMQG